LGVALVEETGGEVGCVVAGHTSGRADADICEGQDSVVTRVHVGLAGRVIRDGDVDRCAIGGAVALEAFGDCEDEPVRLAGLRDDPAHEGIGWVALVL